MDKNFDLFKFLILATVVFLVVAVIGTIEFNFNFNADEIVDFLQEPLEIRNWHYALLIWVIYISGNKSD